MIYANLTVGQLRQIIKDLPDNMPVIINQSSDEELIPDIGVARGALCIDEVDRFPESDDDDPRYTEELIDRKADLHDPDFD
jgi:hypothetical protein